MTEKTIEDLLVDFEAGQHRGITSAKMRDLIGSVVDVLGIMYTVAEQTQNITESFQPLTIWTNSKDTKGLTEDFVNGVYDVKQSGLGKYVMLAVLNVKLATPTVLEACTALNGAAGSYRARTRIGTDEGQLIVLGQRKAKFDNDPTLDTLGIEIKADSGPVLATFTRSQFYLLRTGGV